ncbi:Glycoside hydrolase family 95 protein [Mycena venus]|uniref:Glycoside hydrolase family 95 protein n=1 Tax=Mycena venus TaxID=2733690 RepID=A0A8H6Z1N8_9AGAR|nr:Glycoside hydrolase family 95 protein [Mycena venus]
MWTKSALFNAALASVAVGAPAGFPASGNGLWYSAPGLIWSRDYLPIGNGFLAAMTPGGAAQEIMQLNIESLWAGGPFQDPTYNGGNKQPDEQAAMAAAMQAYRDGIFTSPTGDIDDVETLTTDAGVYGSYVGAGYLISTLNVTGAVSNYARWLDMDQSVARVTWTQAGSAFTRETLCSNPTQACSHHVSVSTGTLPPLSLRLLLRAGRRAPHTQHHLPRLQHAPRPGDRRHTRHALRDPRPRAQHRRQSRLHTTARHQRRATQRDGRRQRSRRRKAWISWVGGTEFDQDAGDAAHGFSFKGPDPHAAVLGLLSGNGVSSASYSALRAQHVVDVQTAFGAFTLDLGQKADLGTSTDELINAYQIDTGNPYLEWLMFNYGRYLLGSSARGALPANLQGKWALDIANPWSGDYHSNINIQMNYWSAEMSNLDVMKPLFTYFEVLFSLSFISCCLTDWLFRKNWAPRGAYTAQVLYNITRGWVTHNEMNIFGHTGMKGGGNTAEWANYPESAVWMMLHVWDHFDYTNDIAWWKAQGWPLIKAVASFHLDKLIPDLRFNDGSLVVSPCNSPEQPPITLGCAHAQQLIWQLFNAVEKGFAASGDADTAFLDEVRTKRDAMDKGLHVGSWGQLQEWKVDQDMPNDTHRHLSHLIGLYPGYAITNYQPAVQGGVMLANGTRTTYTKAQVMDATTTSLIHRGNGTGPDADSGWEKMWRAACWAQLKNSSEFYHELTYGIFENFGANLFSLYDPFDADPIFQIDANLGLPGAVLNALLQAPDVPTISTPLVITLLPAIPSQWASGSMKGARTRGGITVNLQWKAGKPTSASFHVDASVVSRPVQVVFGNKVVASFTTSPGLSKTVTSF